MKLLTEPEIMEHIRCIIEAEFDYDSQRLNMIIKLLKMSNWLDEFE